MLMLIMHPTPRKCHQNSSTTFRVILPPDKQPKWQQPTADLGEGKKIAIQRSRVSIHLGQTVWAFHIGYVLHIRFVTWSLPRIDGKEHELRRQRTLVVTTRASEVHLSLTGSLLLPSALRALIITNRRTRTVSVRRQVRSELPVTVHITGCDSPQVYGLFTL